MIHHHDSSHLYLHPLLCYGRSVRVLLVVIVRATPFHRVLTATTSAIPQHYCVFERFPTSPCHIHLYSIGLKLFRPICCKPHASTLDGPRYEPYRQARGNVCG